MGKRAMRGLGLLLAACMLFGGCGDALKAILGDGKAPASSSNSAQGNSDPAGLPPLLPATSKPASQAVSLPPQSSTQDVYAGLSELDAAILRQVNDVLAGYADGSYPIPMQYHTEFYGVQAYVPPGLSMPVEVGMDVVSYQQEYSEFLGSDYLEISVELGDGILLDVETPLGEDGLPAYISYSGFGDAAGWQTFEAMGNFTNVVDSKVYGQANYNGIQVGGGTWDMYFSWEKGGMLWLSFSSASGSGFMHVYLVDENGNLTQDYPTDEFREMNASPLSDAEAMELAYAVLEEYKAALGG